MNDTKDATLRPIDLRFTGRSMPPVSGIDLVHALNFISVADAGKDFIYNHYTSSEIFYTLGNRPELESIVHRVASESDSEIERVSNLANFIVETVPHAMFYMKNTSKLLSGKRSFTEEEIINSGFAWCNEQARVFCCLTQIAGIPSRLIFAGNSQRGYGHTVSEVLLSSGWMMVDQTVGYCFAKNDKPVRAVDVYGDQDCRKYFEPIYKTIVTECTKTVPEKAIDGMFTSENPLNGYKGIGVHNHFVL